MGRRSASPWPRRRRRRLSRGAKIALWMGGGFVGLLGALAVAVLIFALSPSSAINSNITTLSSSEAFPKEETRPAPSENGSRTILLLGSDARGAVSAVADQDPDNQRSDVMMVVRIDADRKNVEVMSVLRDSWIEIPGHGRAKANAAYSWGGAPLAVATVENLLGVRIDHVALIGFDGFADMTNALGGITVNNAVPFTRDGFDYVAGANRLNGAQALGFVRERYSFTDGDYQRARNQQEFLRAIATQAISANTLSNPERIFSFTTAVTKHLAVDESFTTQAMFELGVSLRDVRPANIHFFTLPTVGTGMEGDQSVVYLDEGALPAIRDALRTDTLDEYVAGH